MTVPKKRKVIAYTPTKGNNQSRAWQVASHLGSAAARHMFYKGTEWGQKKLKQMFNHWKKKTFTKAKRSRNYSTSLQNISQHNDLSGIKKTIVLNPPQKLYKKLGKWDYRWSIRGSTQNVETEGQQYAVDVIAYMTQAWSIGAVNSARSNQYGLQSNIFDLNPYQVNTGGTVIGSILKPTSDYVHVHDIMSDYLITNFSQVAAWVEVRWFMAKTNVNNSPVEQWYSACSDKQLGQASEAPQASTSGDTATAGAPTVILASPTLGGNGIRTHYGMSPTAERQFNMYYKTLQKCSFALQGGDTRKIALKIEVNKTMSKSFALAATQKYLKNGTIFCTIIVRPSTALVQDTSGFIEPTTAQVSVAWVVNNKVNLSSLGGQRLEYNRGFTTNTVTTVPAHTVLNEVIVNDADAQITNQHPA